MKRVEIPPTRKDWALCPYCGAKTIIYDNRSNCKGVYVKCTRGCRQTFELNIKDGKQIFNT